MTIITIYTIISFLLDGLMSNYINTNLVNPSYLRTIYSIVALVIIFSYFENKQKYLIILFILGILFDIVYTNTLLLNIVIFFIIFLVLNTIDYYIPNNLFTISIKSIIAIIIYHLISYFILILTNYNHYSLNLLILIIIRSLIMTIIYSIISYLLIKKIYFKRFNKKIK